MLDATIAQTVIIALDYMVQTIVLTISAITTFVGTITGLSNMKYKKENK